MESRILLFLLMVLLAAPLPLAAQDDGPAEVTQAIDPRIERREIRRADIDSEDFEAGAFIGFMSVEDFGTNALFGAQFAYHITDAFFVEAVYGQTDTDPTSFEELSGGAPLLSGSDRDFTYYSLSLAWNVLPGEAFFGDNRAYNTAFYVLAGAGNTEFGGDDNFTINIGAGYRVLLNDWLSVRAEFQNHMFDSDLLGDEKTIHNLEAHVSVTAFF